MKLYDGTVPATEAPLCSGRRVPGDVWLCAHQWVMGKKGTVCRTLIQTKRLTLGHAKNKWPWSAHP